MKCVCAYANASAVDASISLSILRLSSFRRSSLRMCAGKKDNIESTTTCCSPFICIRLSLIAIDFVLPSICECVRACVSMSLKKKMWPVVYRSMKFAENIVSSKLSQAKPNHIKLNRKWYVSKEGNENIYSIYVHILAKNTKTSLFSSSNRERERKKVTANICYVSWMSAAATTITKKSQQKTIETIRTYIKTHTPRKRECVQFYILHISHTHTQQSMLRGIHESVHT